MKIYQFALAAFVAASPIVGASIGWGAEPSVGADNSKEATEIKDGSSTSLHKPGSTGTMVVQGDKSTVAGDKGATAATKTGSSTSK
jgi:hypothetical protein